jgi:hypothetical protein
VTTNISNYRSHNKYQQNFEWIVVVQFCLQLACKTEREFRAVEICKMMPDPHMVQLAIKYASRLNLISLAEKLNDVVRMKHEEEMAKVMGTQYQEEEDEDYRPGMENGYVHLF